MNNFIRDISADQLILRITGIIDAAKVALNNNTCKTINKSKIRLEIENNVLDDIRHLSNDDYLTVMSFLSTTYTELFMNGNDKTEQH